MSSGEYCPNSGDNRSTAAFVNTRMILNPEEHKIDRAGQLLLRQAVADMGWVVNFVSDDYGIDCNIQMFANESPTGSWFHVQLKSSNSAHYSSDGTFISQKLSVSHARHYALEMRQPIFVIHADIKTNLVRWYSPQLDRNLVTTLEDISAETVTVRIPTNQQFPSNVTQMLSDLKAMYLVLANREILSSSADSFMVSIKHLPDQEELRRQYQAKCDILKLRKVEELYRAKDFGEAKARIRAILVDLDSATEIKFRAQVHLRGIEYSETLFSGVSEHNLYKVFLDHAIALRKLTKAGPGHLKFFSIISKSAAQMGILVYEDSVLFMAQTQHLQKGGNPLAALELYVKRSALSRRIAIKYNQCLRLANIAASYPDRWSLGAAITEIANAIAPYLITLRAEGLSKQLGALTRSALHFCQLAAWIGDEIGDLNGILMSIIAALAIAESESSEAFQWANQIAAALRDTDTRLDAESLIERAVRRWNGEHVEGDYKADTDWQIVRKLANANGIDTSNEKDPMVQSLKIAARDSNPERVLIRCEHLLASQGAVGPNARFIANTLNIHTAGSKVIHCLLHDFHLERQELDLAYEHFASAHCSKCSDSSPRPQGWRYRGKVRIDIETRHAQYIAQFVDTPFGRRFTKSD